VGFANLLLGVLGFIAIHRRDGFRLAIVIAVAIFSVGATVVHLIDIVGQGNLAPGNTIQNVSNLLRPLLLIGFSVWGSRINAIESEGRPFLAWQMRQQPVANWAAIRVNMGFGLGFALDAPLSWTLVGALIGVLIGQLISNRQLPAS
jgi:hypothetical protein